MMGMLRHLFTGIDNTTWDLGRFIWAKMSIGYIVITVIQMWHGVVIDLEHWTTGAGILMTGGGASIVIKRSTEPTQ
jgi:hypothetical protein